MKTTRQILFAALASILSIPAAHAQIALDLKVGSNFGTVRTTEMLDNITPDFQYAPGWTAGGIAEINFGRYFALQSEINWVQKGFRFDEAFDIPVGKINIPAGAEATVRTNYVEVPLLAKLKLGNDRVQAYALLGPSFGYGLNGKIITRTRLLFELDPINTNLDFDQLNYERFEVSGTGGLGVQFNFNGVKVFADARYTHGFTELYNFPIVNEQIKNRGLRLARAWLWTWVRLNRSKNVRRCGALRHGGRGDPCGRPYRGRPTTAKNLKHRAKSGVSIAGMGRWLRRSAFFCINGNADDPDYADLRGFLKVLPSMQSGFAKR